MFHREGGLVAVSADDWTVRVIDVESRSIVREVWKNLFGLFLLKIGEVLWSFQSSDCHVFQW